MGPERLVELIRRERPIVVLMIAFLAFPFMAQAWIDLLPNDWPGRYWVLAPLLIVFGLLVGLMMMDTWKIRRQELARDLTIDYLRRRGFSCVSFSRLETRFPEIPIAEFKALPSRFHNVFDRVTLKGGVPGLKWTDQSDEAPEETE